MCRCHPYIWMWAIFDFGTNSKTPICLRQDIEHGFAWNECRCSEGNLQLVAGAIIISAHLFGPLRDSDSVESGHFGWVEIIQSGIDVPSIKACYTFFFVFGRYTGLVERGMTGMFEFGFGETFVVVNYTIADELHLRNTGDGFKIRVKDWLLRTASLVVSVTITLGLRIKCLMLDQYQCNCEDWNQTFVRAYCWAGERTTSLKRRASYYP